MWPRDLRTARNWHAYISCTDGLGLRTPDVDAEDRSVRARHQQHGRGWFGQVALAQKPIIWGKLSQSVLTFSLALKTSSSCVVCLSEDTPYYKPVVFNLGVTTPDREPLEGARVDILCAQLYYTCFIRVLDGVRWVRLGCYNGSRCKKGRKPLYKLIRDLRVSFPVVPKRGGELIFLSSTWVTFVHLLQLLHGFVDAQCFIVTRPGSTVAQTTHAHWPSCPWWATSSASGIATRATWCWTGSVAKCFTSISAIASRWEEQRKWLRCHCHSLSVISYFFVIPLFFLLVDMLMKTIVSGCNGSREVSRKNSVPVDQDAHKRHGSMFKHCRLDIGAMIC